ncbi:hypothetical protein P170DRAFT_510209 [Aspergillus steynii IBT 23096]|uniref:DUF7708 domain-containing protein n=1 Tax=Aspergillus steynii IBT 23096 TaxID=1392250 RepID=A0A2I2GA12_9EURO|nr:uncharacterized protein P170DRAFT_510209 [Aspergillus steynii IBT 23096]PLB49716.1 hypothetical protein P170DRAFT_510209 [Aspergillus steynii IBT 23096]
MYTGAFPRPRPARRAATIDFMENRLPELHPAFKHTHLQYDAISQDFVPAWMLGPDAGQIPPRPESAPVNAMKFWAQIFPESMTGLKDQHPEPQGLAKAGFSIRNEKSWQGVCNRLEKAKVKYEIPQRKSVKAIFRKSYRKIAGKTDQLKTITKIGAQLEYISPFLVAVDILLDAAATAAQFREQVATALDPQTLEEDFERIEFFLATYTRDRKIQKASVDLVVAILKAIEDAMVFFQSSQWKRIWGSVTQGKDYQSALTESMSEIKRHSSRLVTFADEANKHSNRTGLNMLIQGAAHLTAIGRVNMQKLDDAAHLADVRDARMFNMVKDLFQMAEEEKKRKRELEDQEEKDREEQRLILERLCDKVDRLESPKSDRPSPSIQPQPPIMPMPIGFMPPLMMLAPPPAWTLFPSWIPPPPPMPVTQDILWAKLGPHHNENVDINHVLFHRLQIPPSSRGRAEAAVSSPEFRRWIAVPYPRELLIQGDPDADGYELSGVSLISALVCSALKGREDHVRLVWFCSLHDDGSDDTSSCSSMDSGIDSNSQSRLYGGVAMLTSFIAQLLQQHAFDFTLWPQGAAAKHFQLQSIAKGQMKTLATVFEWLVRQIPAETTLSIVIDQIGRYETDDFMDDMLAVLKLVLGLRRSEDVNCIVKVLVTSSEQTNEVCDMFQDDGDSFLDFDALEEMEEIEESDLNPGGSGDEED